jgi:hypothetical protein
LCKRAPGAVKHVQKAVHPYETIIASEPGIDVEQMHAENVREESIEGGKIVHLVTMERGE